MLDALLRPRSIVILGASADPERVSGRVLQLLRRNGFSGRIDLVNPRRAEIDGLRCHASAGTVPGPIDLAIIALSAAASVQAIEDLGQRGDVGAAVVFASGFRETGSDGMALEQELGAAAKRGGIRLLGPNTLGLVNAFDQVVASFGQYPVGGIPAGPIALATQSGAFGTAIAALARLRSLPVGYFIATGNEVDVDVAEALEAALQDPRVAVGAAYLEGLRDGARFISLAENAARAGKPLVVVKVGRSAAGARAATSHTGALAGEDAVFDGLCHQFGVIRARNEEHLLDVVETLALSRDRKVNGFGLGIITMSGGAGALIADRAEEIGLHIPTLAASTRAELQRLLPGFAATSNPVDVTGQFLERPGIITDTLVLTLADPGVSLGVVWLPLLEAHANALVAALCDARAATDKPFAVAWVAAPEHAVAALHAAGIPVLRSGDAALDGLVALVQAAQPGRGTTASDEGATVALPAGAGPLATAAVARLLEAAGVHLARALHAETADAAVAAAEQLGYPVALKIDSPDIPHKTEAAGVRLNLADAVAVRAAHAQVMAAAMYAMPTARALTTIVQKMVRGTVEMTVGLRHDPIFGAVIMAGLGGTLIEVTRDVAFRIAPIDAAEADRMLDDLRLAPRLLAGARGQPAANRPALAQMIAAVSRLGAAAGPRLAELDLNPVMVGPEGATAVDWLMVLNGGERS